MVKRRHLGLSIVSTFLVFLCACQATVPKDVLKLPPQSLEVRQRETRIFETNDEKKLLSAGAALLQDLGYQLDESEVSLGVIVASRDRDVKSAGEIIGSVIIAALFGVYTPVSRNQKVLASFVTRPLDEKRIAVRVTFQHMVWDTDNNLIKNEIIDDPKIYQEFFEKLSKAVFLEAHGL
ncbi:MAG: hypothetical protein DRH15_13470 [Deltaproteobacteria bacterium]|nr:MAG: hypothetical protein DRH15_13470 [Deltaproteobacteria bacterium]